MSKPRAQLIKWLRGIDVGGKAVLDVGCGPEHHWARRWTKGEPSLYVTWDVDPQFGADIQADLNRDPWLFIRNWNAPVEYKPFDVVFCLETLEHVWDPVRAVTTLYDCTAEGGTCYISVPFINPIHDKWDHLRYTHEWFREVLPKAGFRKVTVTTRRATAGRDLLRQFYKAEGLRMSRIRYKAGDGPRLFDVGYCVGAVK